MAKPIPNNSPPSRRAVPRLALTLDTKGGANPADAAAADINTIVAQYKKYGTIPNINRPNALFGDFTASEDIHEMREIVNEAQERFEQLPADVRTLANNDMAKFVHMFSEPEGREALEAAGLLPTEEIKDTKTPALPEPATNPDKLASSPPASTTDTQ